MDQSSRSWELYERLIARMIADQLSTDYCVTQGDDYGKQCRCKLPWFWLASIEQDDQGHKSAELHAVLRVGEVITVDKRGL